MTEVDFDAARLLDLRRSMSGEDFVRLVQLVSQDLGLRLAGMHAALDLMDRDGLGRDAHSILGVAGNIGATALAASAKALNTAASGATPGELARMLEDLTHKARATDGALGLLTHAA